MKIYLYGPVTYNQWLKSITNYLKRAGIIVIGETDVKAPKKQTDSQGALAKYDALVVLADKADMHASYLTALSLAQNKDVLCLVAENKSIDSSLENLKKDSHLAKKLHIEFYNTKNLLDKVAGFLKLFDKVNVSQAVNIKYTLRVSSKLNDYLNWKAKHINIAKADWLRDKIKELMDDDEDYQKFLQDKYKPAKN